MGSCCSLRVSPASLQRLCPCCHAGGTDRAGEACRAQAAAGGGLSFVKQHAPLPRSLAAASPKKAAPHRNGSLSRLAKQGPSCPSLSWGHLPAAERGPGVLRDQSIFHQHHDHPHSPAQGWLGGNVERSPPPRGDLCGPPLPGAGPLFEGGVARGDRGSRTRSAGARSPARPPRSHSAPARRGGPQTFPARL